jgi:hypothetical protein
MTTTDLSHSWLVTAMAAAVVVLAGCGGGSSDTGQVASLSGAGSASAAPADQQDLEKQLDDYVECLRKQGMDLPDPTVDADGRISFGRPAGGQSFDRDAFDKAQKVCGAIPAGLTAGFDAQDQAEMQDAALKFAQCMRGEGVDVPDPDLSKLGQGGGSAGGPFGDLDRDDPEVAAAIEVCQKVWTDVGITPRGAGGGS